MNNDLPRVYANPIDKTLNNNLEYYVASTKNANVRSVDSENILKKINEIFASSSHVYKSNVLIKFLSNEEIETMIVGKTGNYLLTLKGEKISINNIASIEKI